MNKIVKQFVILFLTLSLISLNTGYVFAQDIFITSSSDASIDTSIIRDDQSYNTPRQIIIAPIFANEEVETLTPEQRYRGIYFYTVEYLGFSDIPYHYIIDKTGAVFEGNKGGPERKVQVEGIGSEIILIGYMTDRSENRFNYRSEDNFIRLLTKVANENNISADLIKVNNVVFTRDETNQTVRLTSSDLFGNWTTSLSSVLDGVRQNFTPKPKTYNLVATDIKVVSSGEVKPGNTVDLSVTIENKSAYGIYGETPSDILFSKIDGGESKFFLNNEWASTTQISILDGEQKILPNSTGTFTFRVSVPLYIGRVSEEFKITNIEGSEVTSNTFSISLDVQNTDQKIIEILDTETGTLNVRSEASSVATPISTASPGQRFFLLEDAGNGWIKIKLKDGKEGWVASWYTKQIN